MAQYWLQIVAHFALQFNRLTAALLILTQFTACDYGMSGQIEKCVQAGMEANKPFKDNTEKAETETRARAYCMRAAAGKD